MDAVVRELSNGAPSYDGLPALAKVCSEPCKNIDSQEPTGSHLSLSKPADEERAPSSNPDVTSDLAEQAKLNKQKDRPFIGVCFYLLYTLVISCQLYCTKTIFTVNPGIHVFQVTALKASISVVIVLITQNRHIRTIVYDQVDREGVPALAFKTFQGSVTIFFNYKSLQCFAVSTVGIVCTISPMVVCILAGCLLGEKVTIKDYLTLLLVTSLVAMVILGAQGTEKETIQTDWVAMVCLIV